MMVMTIEIKNRIEKNVPIITSIDRENFLKENAIVKKDFTVVFILIVNQGIYYLILSVF